MPPSVYVPDSMMQQYFAIIKTWAGGNDEGTRVVFPCADGTTAPSGGQGVPDAVTNNAMYDIADKLLTLDNKIYTSGGERSYFQDQMDYLGAVLLPKDASPAAAEALKRATAKESEATSAFTKLNQEARQEWMASLKWEPCDYATFLVNNRQDVVAAKNAAQAATASKNAALGAVEGFGSANLSTYNSRFSQLFGGNEMAGYSFKTSPLGYNMVEYIKQVQAGNIPPKPADPPGTINKASYKYDALYSQRIDDLYKAASSNTYTDSLSFSANTYQRGSTSSGGSSGGSGDVDAGSWLKIRGNASESWSESKSNSEDGNISVEVSIKDKIIISVSPGNWDVPGYRKKYPDVGPGAPPAPEKVVKPCAMLLAAGVRYTINFSGEKKSAFDKEMKKVKEGGGSISVFGITINFGAKPEESHEETHDSTFDGGSGTLTLQPKPQLGSASLLAMIGEKMD